MFFVIVCVQFWVIRAKVWEVEVKESALDEWCCNPIAVFCLYSNTVDVKVALREPVEKQLPLKRRSCIWRQERGSDWQCLKVVRAGEEGRDSETHDGGRQGERRLAEGGERGRGSGGFTWRGERGRGAKNCQQLSSPWTELSLRASAWENEKKKSLSLLNLQLTPEYVTTSISTPLRCWTQKARHASCESA